MMHAGYLAPVAGYRVETDIDLSRVKTSMGDFVVSQLSDAVNIESRNALVVKAFRELVPDRRTLVFGVDVAHALDLAAAFRHYGITAAPVTGDTPPDERGETLAAFSSGRIQVLTNCMVLTEGYDEPAVDGIILARPTKSALLYTQMIGRGTRLHPGKTDVTVVDVVDNSSKHRLVTLPSLFGLAENFNLKGRTTSEVRARNPMGRDQPSLGQDRPGDRSRRPSASLHPDRPHGIAPSRRTPRASRDLPGPPSDGTAIDWDWARANT